MFIRSHMRGMVFFFQAEDGIRGGHVTGVQTCALPICGCRESAPARSPKLWRPVAARVKIPPHLPPWHGSQIGRASCRERVKISGGAGTLKKRKESEDEGQEIREKRGQGEQEQEDNEQM